MWGLVLGNPVVFEKKSPTGCMQTIGRKSCMTLNTHAHTLRGWPDSQHKEKSRGERVGLSETQWKQRTRGGSPVMLLAHTLIVFGGPFRIRVIFHRARDKRQCHLGRTQQHGNKLKMITACRRYIPTRNLIWQKLTPQ